VDELVLGIEASSTVCALLADVDGTMLGVGRAAGANATAYPVEVVSERLAGAIISTLGATPATRVAYAVVGMAGLNDASESAAHAALERVWQQTGLTCPVRVVSDPVAAFAAGTHERSGAVLIAGTGSIAAWISDETVVHRVDGHGWLVGDDGSGFWLGRQAVRAVLAELDGRGEPTLLRMAVLGTLADSDELPSDPTAQLTVLRGAVYDQPPIALSRLAPLVPAAAEAGDRVAQRIVDRAVTLLVDTIDALYADLKEHGDVTGAPVVLAGDMLTSPGRIQREVLRRTAERYGRHPTVADNVAGGAAWLALRSLHPDAPEAVHTRLRTP
jgi:N-acetylglucosamine kinase-like BadF-type ATPase